MGADEFMIDFLVGIVKAENLSVFETHTVGELMFEGRAHPILRSAVDMGLVAPARFGFFFERNNSISKEFVIHNGVRDLSNYGRLVSYDGVEQLNYWKKDSCNRLDQSTPGDLNPPFQFPMPSTLKIFANDLCRTLSLRFNGTVKHERITTNRYILPSYAFNYDVDPENQCYCLKK